jgi:glycosyltransferase involved in cell wall biosynthesis
MSNIRVMIIGPNPPVGRGGIERQTLYLTRELAAAHPEVQVRALATRSTGNGRWRHLSTVLCAARLAAALLTWRPTLLHVNVAPRGSTYRKMLFVAIGRVIGGAPVALHLHGSGYDRFYESQPAVMRALIRAFFRRADMTVVMGRAWSDFVRMQLGVAPERIRMIDNGVPPRRTSRRREPGDGPLRIVFLGEIGERKGVSTLLRALASPHLEGVPWRAVLAGPGELTRYRALRDALGLAGKAELPGWLNEDMVEQLLADADVLVLASRAENQPLSILEAMAHGIPVVATPVGAIPEQVENEVTGLLVPIDDDQALALALRRLGQSPPLRQRLGAAAEARHAQRYSTAAHAEAFAGLYTEVQRRPRATWWRRWLGRLPGLAVGLLAGQLAVAPAAAETEFDRMVLDNELNYTVHAQPYAVRRATDRVRAGSLSLRFEIHEDDAWQGGTGERLSYRAELSDPRRRPLATSLWYTVSILLPKGTVGLAPWSIVAQWHATPDPGEVWRSPPLAFSVSNRKLEVRAAQSAKPIQTSNDGKKFSILTDYPLESGCWHDFVVHVRFNYKSGGYVDIWHQQEKIVSYRGPIGYNDEAGVFFKAGIYRPNNPEVFVVYIDEYRSGLYREDVWPTADGEPIDGSTSCARPS